MAIGRRGGDLNLVVLFLSDVGPSLSWEAIPLDELATEAAEREIELVYVGKASPDVVLRLPEGTKTWDARVGFETAWRAVIGTPASFIARSARNLAMSMIKGAEVRSSLELPKRGISHGMVFMETRGLEKVLEEECDRIIKSLGEAGTEDILVKKPIEQGDILVVKRGKEEDQPSFARVARVVQECYRLIVGKPVNVAGRGMKVLGSLQAVIGEHAPKMLADLESMHGVRREMENSGLA